MRFATTNGRAPEFVLYLLNQENMSLFPPSFFSSLGRDWADEFLFEKRSGFVV